MRAFIPITLTVFILAYSASASINRADQVPQYGKGEAFTVYLPNLQPGWQELALVKIPAGAFKMGSPDSEEGREENEGPVHTVTLTKDFYIGKYEITQAQWIALMDENPSTEQGANLPVNRASWDDCQEFIRRLNKYANETRFRLPTEAEFEYAARAGTTTPIYFSENPTDDELAEHAWFRNNSDGVLKPVGQLKPNPFGLHDIFGNVWEWCHDWYAPYTPDAVIDPSGPKTGTEKVHRGASWMGRPAYFRAADRGKFTPDNQRNTGGFRLVWSEITLDE